MTTTGQSLAQAAISEIGSSTALARLLSFLGANVSPGGVGSLTNVLFVDQAYDGSSPTGSISAPFPTVTEAMAAITEDNTTVVIFPGTYAELVVIPPTRNGISLVGLSRRNTRITGTGAAATSTVLFHPTSQLAVDFELSELTISSTSVGGVGIDLDASGAGTPTSALANVLIQNVDCLAVGDAALGMVSVGGFTVRNCFFDDVTASNCGPGKFSNCTMTFLGLGYNAAAGVLPSDGRGIVRLEAGTRVSGALELTNHPSVYVDESSVVGSISADVLSVSGGLAPVIEFYGQQGTTLIDGTISIILPTAAVTASKVDFSGSTLRAPSVAVSTAGGTQPFDFRKADLKHAAGVVALTGAGVGALDVRGMTAKVAIPYTVAGGAHTVDRDRIVALSAAVTAAAKTFTFGTTAPFDLEPPFPAGATYAVTGTDQAAAAALDDYLTVTAKSATAFTTGAMTNAKTIDIVLTRTGQLALASPAARPRLFTRAGPFLFFGGCRSS